MQPSAFYSLCAIAVSFACYFYLQSQPYRSHNFSAGPSRLSDSVLLRIQKEYLDFHGHGIGFQEMSHRDSQGQVQILMKHTVESVKKLLSVPDNYHVLFMHGGAHGQFSAVPLNLGHLGQEMNYVITGFWSTRASNEAEKHGKVKRIEGAKDGKLLHPSSWNIDAGKSAFVHICSSETIHGLEFLDDQVFPDDVILVADFTSTLLSRAVNISKYGLIYASSGKNLGPAGLTLVIIRQDLVSSADAAAKHTPSILNYHLSAFSQPISSIYNTPPTYQIYVLSYIVDELIENGGLDWVSERAKRRAASIYDIIDNSKGFYTSSVDRESRSRMSIPFRILGGDVTLEKKFLEASNILQMSQLHGHPMVGGLRVTLYNGIPDDSVQILAKFLKDFMTQNQK